MHNFIGHWNYWIVDLFSNKRQIFTNWFVMRNLAIKRSNLYLKLTITFLSAFLLMLYPIRFLRIFVHFHIRIRIIVHCHAITFLIKHEKWAYFTFGMHVLPLYCCNVYLSLEYSIIHTRALEAGSTPICKRYIYTRRDARSFNLTSNSYLMYI